jgi:hypothetical protein
MRQQIQELSRRLARIRDSICSRNYARFKIFKNLPTVALNRWGYFELGQFRDQRHRSIALVWFRGLASWQSTGVSFLKCQ